MAAVRVLVVEDDPALRDVLALVLEDEGYVVDTAVHGAAALATVARARPAVVITDLMMPVMDGIALCQALTTDPATDAIPIVMTSAGSNRPVADRCHFAAFLPKPINFATLLRVVAALSDAPLPGLAP
jgi:CheY-like chemotaxis protein